VGSEEYMNLLQAVAVGSRHLIPASFSKVTEIRRHYRSERKRCRPWARFETKHLLKCITHNNDSFGDIRHLCCVGTRNRSVLEVYDRYVLLLLLISMEIEHPVCFLHAPREQRSNPRSNLWKNVYCNYEATFKSYFGLATRVPGIREAPPECIKAARSNFLWTQTVVADYMGFYDYFVYARRTPLAPFHPPPDFWMGASDLGRLHLYRSRRGWSGTFPSFTPQAREDRLARGPPCPFDPDNRVAPLTNTLDFRRIIRWYGVPDYNKMGAVKQHYSNSGSSYLPWTLSEDKLLHRAIISFATAGEANVAASVGGRTSDGHALAFPDIGVPNSVADLFELQSQMRGSTCRHVHYRSLVEIHDRCLLLLALRAVGFGHAIPFLHLPMHHCVRMSGEIFFPQVDEYRRWFYTLNGADMHSRDCSRRAQQLHRASYHGPSIAFRMFREYHNFYVERNARTSLGSPCFDYFFCDLQELAAFIL
jgi:hypothetical protein